jgi:hypothetical protein
MLFFVGYPSCLSRNVIRLLKTLQSFGSYPIEKLEYNGVYVSLNSLTVVPSRTIFSDIQVTYKKFMLKNKFKGVNVS